MGTFVAILFALLLWAGIIWNAVRAKPLADKPYRWGRFVGIQCALVALLFFYMNYWRFPDLRILSLVISCAAGVSSVGMLRRKKLGVVMFAATQVLTLLFELRTVAWDQVSSVLIGPLQTVILSIVTIAYFKKRWSLLAGKDQKSSPIPAVGDGTAI